MVALVFLLILAVIFGVVWINLAKNANPEAKIGPDGTNVREPETFVVHHEGKAQGLDIANTALKERTEHVRRDLPGTADAIKTPVPGRDMIRMDAPPSDISQFGDEKVAPGAVPGMPGAESKETVLTQGPKGSRPETPEEPGSPYAKGRRVTDTRRDIEAAAELLPGLEEGQRRLPRDMAASHSTNGQEPGYGLGRTAPGRSDGERDRNGDGDDDFPVEQPDLTDDIPDIPEGDMPEAAKRAETAKRQEAPGRTGPSELLFQPTERLGEVVFEPDPHLVQEVAGEWSWDAVTEELPLPDTYGEDTVVAVVRNPQSLYVYWERSGFGDENLRSMLGEETWHRAVPALRVYDVTGGAYPGQPVGSSFLIPVGEDDENWFIHDGIEPGHRYVVAYERVLPEGASYLIAHSAPVQTPVDRPAHWSQVSERYHGDEPGGWSGTTGGKV